MADWDTDGLQLEVNVKRVLREIRHDAGARVLPSVESVRRWHVEIMRGLEGPDPVYVGAFRGEPGLERVQVRIGAHFGVAAHEVAEALTHFEQLMQRAVRTLDERIKRGSELSNDHVAAVIDVCAWTHAEWIRIHPFVNGNGRIARLWVNSIALRYGLPPFLPPRPRPGGAYGAAAEQAMRRDWKPTAAVLHRLLEDFSTAVDASND